MAHSHAHDHAHAQVVPANLTRSFVIGIAVNLFYVGLEAGMGLWLHSLALLSDAGHNLSDVISLVLALAAIRLSQKKPTDQYTFGFSKSTILVSLFNALLLMLAVGAIGWEALQRIGRQPSLDGGWIAAVSGVGILVNAGTAFLFLQDKEHDINVKGAYLHMAADALVSLGVVVSGLVILLTGWTSIDTIMSFVVIAVIVYGTWGLLKESLRLTLDGVPRGVDLTAIRQYLLAVPGVMEVHDLHIWAMSTTENSLTAHLVVSPGQQNLLPRLHDELYHQFHIRHITIQIEEPGRQEQCLHSH
ncbi:MAG: cation diffusion facilitator family transporter [Adhaeribacter sp.]